VNDLISLNLWDEDMKNMIIIHKGSIQNIPNIPDDIKEIYKTVWEIKQKDLIEMSAERGKFICQSQSLNLFIEGVNAAKLTAAHFHSWKMGLKTGMYYLRTKAAVDALSGLGIDSSKYKTKSPSIANVEETVNIANDDKNSNHSESASEELKELANQAMSDISCSLDNPDDCISCGS